MPQSKLNTFTITYDNSEEYHHLKNEIYTQDTYFFETDTTQPVIIDAGAHIGLATLYFKRYYPSSRVIAIEPNPESYQLLTKNIWDNNLSDVETFQVALSDNTGTTMFYRDTTPDHWWSTAGIVDGSWNRTQQSEGMPIPTQTLNHFLTQPIDFLKMDIEGAEQAVLIAAGDHLKKVKHMMVEFHPHPNQSLPTLLEFLQKQGFEYQLWRKGQPVKASHARGLVIIEATFAS